MKPTILIFTLAVFLCACSTEYRPSEEIATKEAVIIGELEVGEFPMISISSTYNHQEDPIFPDDADLADNLPTLSNLDPDGQKNIGMRYSEQRWIGQSFQFKQGQTISFNAELGSMGMHDVYAETTAPIEGSIATKTDAVLNGDYYTFDLSLSELELDDNFYHLIPFLAASADARNKTFLKSTVTPKGSASAFALSHMDGILFDIRNVDNSNSFEFKIKSSELASNPSHIYLKLKTVPKAYYDFHKSLTIQSESDASPFSAPVPTVSNIEGGEGLFIAYTVSMDSIQVIR